VADLVAIGYPDERSAIAAEEDAQQVAEALSVQPDAIAAVVRTGDGRIKVTTNHHAVDGKPTYGMFWELLFGVLLFVPVLGMPVGAGLGSMLGTLERSGIDAEFQKRVRGLLQPGTSALFFVAQKGTARALIEALGEHRGTVLRSSLGHEAEEELQRQLHGLAARQPAGV
jgi:uncharacterized membrane protein